MVSRAIKKSVLVPLIFFSWFKFPLNWKELRRYLWQGELTEEELAEAIKEIPIVQSSGDQFWYGSWVNDRGHSAD